jgi:aminopeptidase N
MALQALRAAVGDDNFFTALRTWTTERAGGNGSVQDFLTVVKRVSGKNGSGNNSSGKNIDDIAQTWLFKPAKPAAPPG